MRQLLTVGLAALATVEALQAPQTSAASAHLARSIDRSPRRALERRAHPSQRFGEEPVGDFWEPGQHVTIVTTASLPWMTGTSINPLLRAAQLSKNGLRVTLMLPWLDPKEVGQDVLFRNQLFHSHTDQEQFLWEWLDAHIEEEEDEARKDWRENLALQWYPGRYCPGIGSIISDTRKGDLLDYLPPADKGRRLVVLEEPEHINWYRNGAQWGQAYDFVAGIAHTNYASYAAGEELGWLKVPVTQFFSTLAFRAHCDLVVQLSATLANCGAPASISTVSNVHGVRRDFIDIGAARAADARAALGPSSSAEVMGTGVGETYFLAKKLWAKGYKELLELLETSAAQQKQLPPIALFGSGPDETAIEDMAKRSGVDVTFHAAIDHAHESLRKYSLFVNPATSDVLCTATAEALAMGKMVLIAEHPSNIFFYRFRNCHTFRFDDDGTDFSTKLAQLAAQEPLPLTDDELHALSWQAATERLMNAVPTPPADVARPIHRPLSLVSHATQSFLSGGVVGEVLKVATGALPDQPWDKQLARLQERASEVLALARAKFSKSALAALPVSLALFVNSLTPPQLPQSLPPLPSKVLAVSQTKDLLKTKILNFKEAKQRDLQELQQQDLRLWRGYDRFSLWPSERRSGGASGRFNDLSDSAHLSDVDYS